MGKIESVGHSEASTNFEADLGSKPVQAALCAASVKQARLAAVSGFLHDFSNAIMGIGSLSESSCKSLAKDDPLKANLKLIRDTAFSARTMLRQITDVFSAKLGERNLVNLPDMVSRQEDLLRVVLPGGGNLALRGARFGVTGEDR